MAEQHTTKVIIPVEKGLAKWFIRLLKGILIGIGAILPGLSGGVLAVIMGVYDQLMAFLGNITQDFLKRLRYFIPIGIGGVVGILIFSVAVSAAFSSYEPIFVCLFIGFVVGTFPSILRQAGRYGRNTSDWIILFAASVFVIVLMFAGDNFLPQVTPSFPVWVLAGLLIGLGVIVPGLSTSNFLIYLGLYDKMANGIKSFNFGVIVPVTIGLVVTVILLAKGANWLFEHHYSAIYHGISGLVAGSCVGIIPTVVAPALRPAGLAEMGISLPLALVLSALMLLLGTVLSWLFSKVEDKFKPVS